MDETETDGSFWRKYLHLEVRSVLELSAELDTGPVVTGRKSHFLNDSLHKLLLDNLDFFGFCPQFYRLKVILVSVQLLNDV